jgi:hypothetical protein
MTGRLPAPLNAAKPHPSVLTRSTVTGKCDGLVTVTVCWLRDPTRAGPKSRRRGVASSAEVGPCPPGRSALRSIPSRSRASSRPGIFSTFSIPFRSLQAGPYPIMVRAASQCSGRIHRRSRTSTVSALYHRRLHGYGTGSHISVVTTIRYASPSLPDGVSVVNAHGDQCRSGSLPVGRTRKTGTHWTMFRRSLFGPSASATMTRCPVWDTT